MEKFRYLTSEDHASWYVANPSAGVEVGREKLDGIPGKRVEIREWVENNCQGRVYAWNRTRTPMTGEPNWGKIVMPQGDMVMHFENEEDSMLFRLTWT